MLCHLLKQATVEVMGEGKEKPDSLGEGWEVSILYHLQQFEYSFFFF